MKVLLLGFGSTLWRRFRAGSRAARVGSEVHFFRVASPTATGARRFEALFQALMAALAAKVKDLAHLAAPSDSISLAHSSVYPNHKNTAWGTT
jgi:hypothetical protein